MMRFGLAVVAYVLPTFALGFIWHLVLFDDYYRALHIYRDDIIIPFGLLSMLIQGGIFTWIYAQVLGKSTAGFGPRALLYGTLGALLSWSYTTLAVAAKNVMTSVPSYILIETSFTLVQWIMVAPLTALAFGQSVKDRALAQA
jgi:hypothetical protein